MRCHSPLILVALSLGLAGSFATCRADQLAEKGREIFNQNQHAVVTVQVVLKVSYSGASKSSESRQEITGTVVDPSGLTVLALSAADPSEMYQRMMSEQASQPKLETEVTDLKILLADGTELPAEIVLRDKDLDLAFIRPKTKPGSPLAAVDLSNSAPAQLLDEVITLNRLNSAAGRAYAASVERISAVVQKPRTFYIPDSTMTSTALGSPAFSPDGKVVGLVVMRAVNSKSGGSRNYRENMTSIILPAEEILKGAKQAPEAKGDSEKKEAPKESTEKK
ncbi:MAG: serine protease [Limisphaerales bacterium]